MSTSMRKTDLLARYEFLNTLPREKPEDGSLWMDKPVEVPQIVLDAPDNAVFTWGFTTTDDGRWGTAPLHQCGYVDEDGVIQWDDKPYDGPLSDSISAIPLEGK